MTPERLKEIKYFAENNIGKLKEYAEKDWHRDQYFSSKIISLVCDQYLELLSVIDQLRVELNQALEARNKWVRNYTDLKEKLRGSK